MSGPCPPEFGSPSRQPPSGLDYSGLSYICKSFSGQEKKVQTYYRYAEGRRYKMIKESDSEGAEGPKKLYCGPRSAHEKVAPETGRVLP